jgi:hypothetical protein
MYIIAMAKAMEIQPKITASTWTWRIWPNANISEPVTKSGKASFAALNDPNPVPITNHKMEEKPKYTAAVPGGMSSFLAVKYLSMVVDSPSEFPNTFILLQTNQCSPGFNRYQANHILENANRMQNTVATVVMIFPPGQR